MAQVIARPSVASLALELRVGSETLATATGFVVERLPRRYLITNWHVVSGIRPDTGAVLSSTGEVPDAVVVLHNQAGALGKWVPRVEALYASNGQPRWLEHPTHRRQVDVVALELAQLDGVDVYPHDPWATGPGLMLAVAGGVSVIGFPFGISGGGGLGVWVQGTVASEPTLDFGGLPSFLIDSRTRPGQSGSPVIAYHAGGAVPLADGGVSIFTGPVEQFLGVYSGRITAQSDLGHVWKARAICEIVDAGARAQA